MHIVISDFTFIVTNFMPIPDSLHLIDILFIAKNPAGKSWRSWLNRDERRTAIADCISFFAQTKGRTLKCVTMSRSKELKGSLSLKPGREPGWARIQDEHRDRT